MRATSVASAAVFLLLALMPCPAPAASRAEEEKAAVEKVIRASIGWALTKDRPLAESVLAHDDRLFIVNPDSPSTAGWDEFVKLFDFWMDPRFKATKFDVRDMRIDLSRSGDVAWWSCILDDLGEWDGRPIGWKDTRWTGVLEKREGKWIIVQMHFSFAQDGIPAETVKKEAWEKVNELYRAWTEGKDAEGFKNCFHPAAVAVGTGGAVRAEGREAVLQAYAAFLKGAKVAGWKLGEENVQPIGRGEEAVATFTYEISMERGGQTTSASGREMMVLVKRGGKWLLVADQRSATPQ